MFSEMDSTHPFYPILIPIILHHMYELPKETHRGGVTAPPPPPPPPWFKGLNRGLYSPPPNSKNSPLPTNPFGENGKGKFVYHTFARGYQYLGKGRRGIVFIKNIYPCE